MGRVELTVEICGMAGDGTIAAGGILNDSMSSGGFFVLAFDSYPAEIRGFGKCVTRSRFAHTELSALNNKTDVLISLDDEQSQSRIPFLADNAIVLFDNNPPSYVAENKSIAAHVEPGMNLYGIPFADLASGAAGTTRGRNMTALGGFAAIFGLSPDLFRSILGKKFKPKGEHILEANLNCFDSGYEFAARTFSDRLQTDLAIPGKNNGPEKVMLSGNIAISEGALAAGLKLYFGYPITPATPIMEYLAKKLPGKGGRVMQMEDEISSIGAVLGSFFAGTRAMTATSGPGFALMTELITHGIMSETPAVIVNAQRGGPSTGLPTKTEQSDLRAAVFGGPGDSPRIVIAPTNVAECYHYTARSFQLAEKYQTPVIVLTDFYLNNRVESVPVLEASSEEILDGNEYPDNSLKNSYNRFQVTESGISPRAIPGMDGFMFATTGLEHTERGIPNYNPENHLIMNEKRHRKIQSALNDLPVPVEFSRDKTMNVGVISWGSTFGSVLEAVRTAQLEGLKTGALKITSLYPYHADIIRSFMNRCAEIIIPELNFGGHLSDLIGYLHRKEVLRLTYTTGVPISPSTILDKIRIFTEGVEQ